MVNREVVTTRLPIFLCPSAAGVVEADNYHVQGAATTHYSAVIEVKKQVYTETFGVPNPGHTARVGTLARAPGQPAARRHRRNVAVDHAR